MSTTFTAEDAKKLKRIVDEGLKIMQEVDDIKGGFRDTVKAVAEELGLKPAAINKAIRTAHKASLEADKEAVNETEELLAAIGRA